MGDADRNYTSHVVPNLCEVPRKNALTLLG